MNRQDACSTKILIFLWNRPESLLLKMVQYLSSNYQLPITNYQLPITNYQLPITNYQRLL
ncbi:hypothetical protein [Microcoleus sp. Z1_B5]|uniref:hypothetical protein n=1 Tax=Microcoleus sp. Z1_B5 TaxID=3055430 RepID=UPI002FD25D63